MREAQPDHSHMVANLGAHLLLSCVGWQFKKQSSCVRVQVYAQIYCSKIVLPDNHAAGPVTSIEVAGSLTAGSLTDLVMGYCVPRHTVCTSHDLA
jgi:hypothetical protein